MGALKGKLGRTGYGDAEGEACIKNLKGNNCIYLELYLCVYIECVELTEREMYLD